MEPSTYQAGASGCAVAFSSVKAAKNVFMILVALAIAGQLAGFAAVHWGGVLDEIHAAPSPSTQPATDQIAKAHAVGSATLWKELLHWAMPAMKFLAVASMLLAVLTLMFAVKLAIVGRLGGIAGLMGAFFWSILLLAIVTPWQQVLGGEFASGALHNLTELTDAVSRVKPEWGATDVELFNQVLYYARFVAYPIVGLLVWLVVMLKFAGGYKESILSPIGTIPERPATPQA